MGSVEVAVRSSVAAVVAVAMHEVAVVLSSGSVAEEVRDRIGITITGVAEAVVAGDSDGKIMTSRSETEILA